MNKTAALIMLLTAAVALVALTAGDALSDGEDRGAPEADLGALVNAYLFAEDDDRAAEILDKIVSRDDATPENVAPIVRDGR